MTEEAEKKPALASSDARFSKLETTQRAQGREIHGFKEAFESFAAEVRGYMRNAGRPNYSVAIATGALALTIAALAASPFMRDQERMESVQMQQSQVIGGMQVDRWTRDEADHRREVVDSRFDKLMVYMVEREDLLRAFIAAVDARLTTHMIEVAGSVPRIYALEDSLDVLREELTRRGEWIQDTSNALASGSAEHGARIEEIERRLQEISAEQRQGLRIGTLSSAAGHGFDRRLPRAGP